MKKIEATITPFKLEAVKDGLSGIGINEMTVFEARECGRQPAHTEVFRGREYSVEFLPKLKLEVLTSDGQADSAIDVILEAARNGKSDEGKVFVSTVEGAVVTARHPKLN